MTSICGECGVVGTTHAACAHCGSHAPRIDVEPRTDGATWTCLECTFKCRMCGFRVPQNSIDMDGAVVCARCGLEQAFDVAQWSVILEEAHATGDLWGDQASAFGQFLDALYVDLGKGSASLAFNGTGENAVNATASPGHPLCEKCHKPLAVTLEAAPRNGRASTTCECGEAASYEVPAAARRLSAPLMATLCSEHRRDRKDVHVDATESAIAVRCPGCSAPLPADAESKFVTCGYCSTQARIPDRTWFKISKKEHVPEKMWLLFLGPSGTRTDALARQKRDQDVRERRAIADREAFERQQREADEAVARANARAAKDKDEQAERDARTAERERQRLETARSDRRLKIIVFGVVAVAFVAVGIYKTNQEHQRAADRVAYEKSIPDCSAAKPGDCMKTAQTALARGNYGPAIDDYEVACNAAYVPACDAVEALCQSPKTGISSRLGHYERYCRLGKLDACNTAGNLYVNADGRGLAKDEPAASKLFLKSCDGGNTTGCDLLAQSCKRGVKESCPASVDAGHRR